jgi:CheY-like chemotaxis protein
MTATESARILVVDDDPLTRLMASEALREGAS